MVAADEQHEVRITLKDVWAAQEKQGALLTKMAAGVDRLVESHSRTDERVQDHEDRIRLLEQRMWMASGAAALAAAMLTTIINLLIK